MTLAYRREIDGLRALAIIPVLLFHAGIASFSGGFIGVDVFFVVSGYLIGGQLLSSMEDGTFSYRDFYLRRVKRILPVFLVVLVVCAVVAWLILHPVALMQFSKSALASLAFVSNIELWLQSGYFDSAAELKPLLHTWSLSIEEQFYILAPVTLLCIYRLKSDWLFRIVFALALTSFCLSEWASREYVAENFYMLPTRAWELLAGVLAAIYELRSKTDVRQHRFSGAIALAGMVAIISGVVLLSVDSPFPGTLALLPVLGTVAIILFARKGIVHTVLSTRWLVGIGLISYSLYLWHQPAFAFTRYYQQSELTPLQITLLLVLVFALSFLSWKFVEKPFRYSKSFELTRKIRLIIGLTLMVSAYAGAALVTDGAPVRFKGDLIKIDRALLDLNPNTAACHVLKGVPENHPISGCSSFFNNGLFDVLIMGDSHSNALAHPLQERLKERGVGSYAISYSSCLGVQGFYSPRSQKSAECSQHNARLLEYARAVGAGKIVITSSFLGYYNESDEQALSSEQPSLEIVDRLGLPVDSEPNRRQRILERLDLELSALASEFDVYLLDPIPRMSESIPEAMKREFNHGRDVNSLGVSLEDYEYAAKDLIALFSRLEQKGVTRVKVSEVLCASGVCINAIDGVPVYRDEHHLTSSVGGAMVAELVVETMGLK